MVSSSSSSLILLSSVSDGGGVAGTGVDWAEAVCTETARTTRAREVPAAAAASHALRSSVTVVVVTVLPVWGVGWLWLWLRLLLWCETETRCFLAWMASFLALCAMPPRVFDRFFFFFFRVSFPLMSSSWSSLWSLYLSSLLAPEFESSKSEQESPRPVLETPTTLIIASMLWRKDRRDDDDDDDDDDDECPGAALRDILVTAWRGLYVSRLCLRWSVAVVVMTSAPMLLLRDE